VPTTARANRIATTEWRGDRNMRQILARYSTSNGSPYPSAL